MNNKVLRIIEQRRAELSITPTDNYINKDELQELWDMQDAIQRGMAAQRRAEALAEFRKTEQYDRAKFLAFLNAREEEAGH